MHIIKPTAAPCLQFCLSSPRDGRPTGHVMPNIYTMRLLVIMYVKTTLYMIVYTEMPDAAFTRTSTG